MPKQLLGVTIRWLEPEEWGPIENILLEKEWASLNRVLSRVLAAFDADGKLIGFEVFECLPHVGPLFVEPEWRGSGITEELTEQMMKFLRESQVRGFMLVAESVFAAKLAEKYGMKQVEYPVYSKVDLGNGV